MGVFFFIILLFVLFGIILLFTLLGVLRNIFSIKKSKHTRNQATEPKRSRKVFEKNEGEYVDFEEVNSKDT